MRSFLLINPVVACMSKTITPEEINQIPYPDTMDFNSLDIEEIIKVHYTSWSSINKSEVYDTSDIQLEIKALSVLNEEGVSFQPSFPQYIVPDSSKY